MSTSLSLEVLKEALTRLLQEDREFLRGVILDAIDGGRLLDAILADPQARLRLATEMAKTIAVPLNTATKEDIQQIRKEMATREELEKIREELRKLEERVERIEKTMATKEDLKRVEDRMATKEQINRIMITLEEEAREVVEWLLKERGIKCTPGRLWLDRKYEFDVYCTTGDLTVVGEAKTKAGAKTVVKTVNRVKRALERWPEKFPGRVVAVLYCMVATPGTVEKAQEMGVWLIENVKERTKVL
ncbi:MAG: hypothetical protein ACK4SY_07225 [Pyrobaculum sp.]